MSDVAALYFQVIRNVVDGVRADFGTEQLDETVLKTLATLWEHKILETGSLSSDCDMQKTTVNKNALAASCNEHPRSHFSRSLWDLCRSF
mmetsp:Transcript_27393/g.67312  ORF Transcript_27393/g.67312 Transcript_27393/m.67312 type:complete len:90 (+) Transcript_27393:147-416(+)